MKKEYKAKSIPLNSNRRLINAVKKAGLETYHPQGPWNGYGYEKLPLEVRIESLSDMRKFNKVNREIEALPAKKALTLEEKKLIWAKRLQKLAPEEYELTLDEALAIADEKLEYKHEQINRLMDRQYERYSVQREKLINKIRRSNPLRRIEDESHAASILAAHDRHTFTNYDIYLEEAHELEEEGAISKGHAKKYAYDRIKSEKKEIEDTLEKFLSSKKSDCCEYTDL